MLDRAAARVVIVDAGGGLVRTVGRQGQGPGEFNQPMFLAVWRDGRFVVSDIGHAAYQVFGSDGELERYVKMTEGERSARGDDDWDGPWRSEPTPGATP